MLPYYDVPQAASELQQVGELHKLLRNWVCDGSRVPFTWATFRAHTSAGTDLTGLAPQLLGPDL